jgi:hypothetical protein
MNETRPDRPALRLLTFKPGSQADLPPLAQKAVRLAGLRPAFAAVIEKIVDDMLDELEGGAR